VAKYGDRYDETISEIRNPQSIQRKATEDLVQLPIFCRAVSIISGVDVR
jgi:hypothetical protein